MAGENRDDVSINEDDIHNDIPNEVGDEYRKMSQEHISRVSKDLLEMINKEGKNNAKFHQL